MGCDEIQVTKDNIDDLKAKDYKFYIVGIRGWQSKKVMQEGITLGCHTLRAIQR